MESNHRKDIVLTVLQSLVCKMVKLSINTCSESFNRKMLAGKSLEEVVQHMVFDAKSALVFINSVGACDFGVYPCLNKAIFEAGRKFFYEMYKAEILGNERASRYMHSCVIEKTC